MRFRLGRKSGAFAVQCSDEARRDADLTGSTATDVLREEATVKWTVVADTDLVQHVVERIFNAGMLLNSTKTGAASSTALIEAAIAELDEACWPSPTRRLSWRDLDRP
jgi:hypothetical protein